MVMNVVSKAMYSSASV